MMDYLGKTCDVCRRPANVFEKNQRLCWAHKTEQLAGRIKALEAELEAELAALQGWLFSVAWSNCDCTTLSNSAEYDPRKHEETCEYRAITMNVHIPAPYPEGEG